MLAAALSALRLTSVCLLFAPRIKTHPHYEPAPPRAPPPPFPSLPLKCSDALNRDDGEWYSYNDSHVSKGARLSGSAAYLLFYVRCDYM